jgi:hypothetical protein
MTRAIERSRHPGIGASACFLLLLAAAPTRQASAQPAASKEYQVKAAFLLNFAQFIQWPATAFTGPNSPIFVGVLGDDPFGLVLEQTFQDELIQGRKLVVKRSRRPDDLKGCHLLFISNSERDQLAEILASLNNAPIVTVGDIEPFAARGGIIGFYLDGNRIRFEINSNAAQRNGLRISSQLLKRAKIVG